MRECPVCTTCRPGVMFFLVDFLQTEKIELPTRMVADVLAKTSDDVTFSVVVSTRVPGSPISGGRLAQGTR